jgi:flagellar assembly protein FliH
MTRAHRFTFGEDFRGRPAEAPDQAARQATDEAALQDAYARGLADGRRQADADATRRVGEALERIAADAGSTLRRLDAVSAEIETEGVAFFEALARRLAGEALAERPLAAIGEAARATFRHLRGVPHLVVRVNESLVEAVEPLLRRLAHEHGFDGRIIVLGSEDVAFGDARLEWADGGIVRDGRALDEAVAAALSAGTDAAGPGSSPS